MFEKYLLKLVDNSVIIITELSTRLFELLTEVTTPHHPEMQGLQLLSI